MLHDYRRPTRCWGHDYAFTPAAGSDGKAGDAVGWGRGIREGDWLILAGPSGVPGMGSPYRVTAIRYYFDPSDMWQAVLVYERDVPDDAEWV